MHSISPKELLVLLHNNTPLQLIDVRSLAERNEFNIGGHHIPLEELTSSFHLIDTNKPVVFYCQKGIRSAIAIQRLEQRLSQVQMLNLQGGMEAWKKMKEENC